jgi:biopolymer transport protein ExbD
MRRSPISSAVAEEEDINLTPMLDVVFILLIFFIVTANFIKEPGLEVNRPDAETSNIKRTQPFL